MTTMTQHRTDILLDDALQRIIEARHHDPFEVLGCHPGASGSVVRVFSPRTRRLCFEHSGVELSRIGASDIFSWSGDPSGLPRHYRLEREHDDGTVSCACDPYTFAPQLGELDIHLIGEGRHRGVWRVLGAQQRTVDGVDGVLFATWAPNAERVSVVGDFNGWDGRIHAMRVRGASGLWELFIPGLVAGARYKLELRARDSGLITLKSDPYGNWFERRPANAARIAPRSQHIWQDDAWCRRRAESDWLQEPMSIYEVHLGSWQRADDGGFLDYGTLAKRLADHAVDLGFTHLELLPVTEHPLDDSWGYQTTGYYAPTSRFGTPDDFRAFVDHCHARGLGVLLDWVPGHFPRDAHGLARFDGSALYEHADPRQSEHQDWGTLAFDFGRPEVRAFLIGSALHWLEEFHVDGLRVDAVAAMLYLDYSRSAGEWVPNRYGGRENLDAMSFVRELNTVVHARHPGCVVIAEESTTWPMVSRPVHLGGLGFSMKWNMGWMHDTLDYFACDPIFRRYRHAALTFAQMYAYSENFVLPFSHDEVVHGKGTLLGRMPGDDWQRHANLRALLALQFTSPGTKLLFMGCEFGAEREWDFRRPLDFALLERPQHAGLLRLVRDLNRLYRTHRCLHQLDFAPEGFLWLDCHDAEQSVISFLRRDAGGDCCIVVLNLTPVPRPDYWIPAPSPGDYREVLNTDAAAYGGSNLGNLGRVTAECAPLHGQRASLRLLLPPLAALVLVPAAPLASR